MLGRVPARSAQIASEGDLPGSLRDISQAQPGRRGLSRNSAEPKGPSRLTDREWLPGRNGGQGGTVLASHSSMTLRESQ
jgi:hypothetical protein